MRYSRLFAVALSLLIAVSIGAYWLVRQPAPPVDLSGKPKLVVLVVFDQMRGDYIKKWQPLFGDGGFKRLQSEGAWYTNCHYPYAYTLTAAGHTSLVTGTTPSRHGIIANEWYDRASSKNIQSTTPPPEHEIRDIAGPHRRKSETVGDSLLRALLNRARVVSLSIKERAAILMAALRAHACYWFDPANGRFVTSPFYRHDHSWVSAFNKRKLADQWLGKNWERFDAQLDYVKYSGPDDFEPEGTGYLQGQTFPHLFQYGKDKDPKKKAANIQNYYDAVTASPMGNELLLEFAKTAITAEKLGQQDTVDLLCISFTSNDYIGHTWGPDSQEVLDVTLRSDALMKELLSFLDEKVGKENYYLAVSADHGVCPMPEMAAMKGEVAGRVDPELLTSKAEAFLNQKFLPKGKTAPWLVQMKRSNTWVYFNYETLKELKLDPKDVERALADWYGKQPGVQQAFTRTELLREEAKEQTELFLQVQRSFYPEASGDVMVILKPYHIFSPPNIAKNPAKYPNYRATHGMPHPYDTHVPLLVTGPRIQPGIRDEPITPQTMASILAEALDVDRPADARYPLPPGLFKR